MRILQGTVYRSQGQIALPKGGARGAALRKASGEDYDASWQPLVKFVYIDFSELTGVAQCSAKAGELVTAASDGTRVLAEFQPDPNEIIPYQLPLAGYTFDVESGKTYYTLTFAGLICVGGEFKIAHFRFNHIAADAASMTGTGRLIPLA